MSNEAYIWFVIGASMRLFVTGGGGSEVVFNFTSLERATVYSVDEAALGITAVPLELERVIFGGVIDVDEAF
jgi:hypothetical protein